MSVAKHSVDARNKPSRTPSVCMHVLTTARTDQRVMREAIALVQAGYDVTIVDIERDESRPTEEMVEGVRLKHLFMPGRFKRTRFKPWFLVKLAGMVARGSWVVAQTSADVYHAHDDTALPGCYIAARFRRRRLVFDAHELPLVQPNLTRWRLLTAIARAALRIMAPRCDGIITVSAPIAEEIFKRYGGPRAMLVRNIPPYIPPLESDRLRTMLELSAEKKIAVYQGGLQANRSLDVLVHAAKFLDPRHLIVLMGDGESRAGLQSLIDREGMGDRIRIIPPVPYRDLLEVSASADAGLIVYRGSYSLNVQYCLPNKLFEYMMAGVPVVCSELDAVAAIVRENGVGVVVPSLDAEVVGKTISATLDDAEGRERMRHNALEASFQTFRWDVEQHNLLALYKNVVGIPSAERNEVAVKQM
jgi:glycosyltransferase involved in cell wall biosynthesis